MLAEVSVTALAARLNVTVPSDEPPLESVTVYGPAPEPVIEATVQVVEVPPIVNLPAVRPVTGSENVRE